MGLFKKKAAKKEAAKDQKKDSKSDDMAMAYGAMRRKKMSKSGKPCPGESCQGCEDKACFAFGGHVGVHGRAAEISGHTYDRERRGKGHNLGGISNAGERIRNANRYGSDMPESKKLSTEDAKDLHREKLEEMRGMKKPNLYAQGGSVVDRIRRMLADGGYIFDDQDQIEHSNYYDELNEDIANEPLYEDDYGTDPTDSNEHGDTLSDADEHGKSLFKKIKLKKAQKGDRGNY